jgi:hypothetical protein
VRQDALRRARRQAKIGATPAMSLSSIGNPAHETIRGVRFVLLGGAGLVAVLVAGGRHQRGQVELSGTSFGAAKRELPEADGRFAGGYPFKVPLVIGALPPIAVSRKRAAHECAARDDRCPTRFVRRG